MTPQNETPADGPGLAESTFPGGNCSFEITTKAHVAQAKIELLIDDIGCNVGVLINTLHAVLALRDAEDVKGMLYSLRRGKGYWKAISLSAAELIAVAAEQQSAIRQTAASQ
ncbi:MAG TPA: hypothetical protein VEK34_11215 [Methylocella sp.]|nr:hypothetical protein [Methylocella sp.]